MSINSATPTSTCPGALSGVTANLFLNLINTLISSKCSIRTVYQEDYGPSLTNGESFDFVVVGSGSAGSIIANRLSENPEWKVLLLEAGEFPPADSEVPGLFAALQKTNSDWQFQTQPSNTSCLGFKDGKCNWPRGKLLGGSTSINGMVHLRGDMDEFDRWESLGNPGWNKESALKYFRKLENFQNSNSSYGTDGPIKLTLKPKNRQQSVLIKAAREAGIEIGKYETTNGFFVGLTNICNGKRWGTARGYISTVRNRTNLYVAVKSHVNKLLINDGRVTSLEVLVGSDKLVNINVEKEAIISAGTINSPKLLQLSGIGPKEFIDEPIVDLPVGKNLYDTVGHFGCFIKFNPTKKSTQEETNKERESFDYFVKREGPLASVGVTNTVWNLNVTFNNEESPRIVYFFHFPVNDTTILPLFIRNSGYNEKTAKSIMMHNKKFELLQPASVLVRPKSQNGFISIGENGKPKITPSYFENEEDLFALADNINHIRKLLETKTLQKYGAQFLDFEIPNCQDFEFDTDEYWRCNVRNFGTTFYQFTSTCKMGTDSNSVVDPRLKVRGIENLRVIDGSVIPPTISTSSSAPTMMIGEKGADLIKEDWGYSQS